MKLILHHLLKDIRVQRWLLLLWTLVLLIPVVLNILIFQPDYDTAKYINALRVSPLLMFLNVIVWTIMVARLIQCEPVTGSTSFWLTRPVPTSVYVPSKLIFLACLVILPGALSSLLSDAQLQATGEMMGDHLLVFLVAQIVGGIAVVWLATYTPGLLHFAGTLCVGLLGLLLFALLSATLIHPHPANPTVARGVDHCVDILVPGLLVSLVVQHWHRRGRAGLIVGLATIVIALVAQACLPPAMTPIARVVHTGKVASVDIAPDWHKQIYWNRRGSSSEAMAVLKPVDDKEVGFVIESATGEFQVPGENPVAVVLEPEFPSMPRFERQMKTLALVRNELPEYSITRDYDSRDSFSPVTLFSLDPTQKTQLQGKTGTLVLKVQGQKLFLSQEAKIPLGQPHFIAHIPGGFIRANSSNLPDDAKLVVWKVSAEKNISWQQDMIYVLVDPRNHTGTLLDSGGSSSSSNSIGGNFRTMDSETMLNVKGNQQLDQMLLYIYDVTPGDSFESTLTAPDFTMNPK